MGKINVYLEVAKETERLTLEGLEYDAALRKAKEIYKEQLKKEKKVEQPASK